MVKKSSLVMFVLVAAACLRSQGEVVTFPRPAGCDSAPDFSVDVNGEEQFVHDSPVAPFVTFAFTGRVEVRITCLMDAELGRKQRYTAWGRTIQARSLRGGIKKLVIRPIARRIKGEIKGNTVSFSLDRSCQLSIELNDNLTRPLFLFADPVIEDMPRSGQAGVRTFAPGKVHDAGEIRVRDNETVYIPGGAVVRGWIRADGVKNARVVGQGVLDGGDPKKVKSSPIAFSLSPEPHCPRPSDEADRHLLETGNLLLPGPDERATKSTIRRNT